ncbi:MAG: Asp-tRNA(Asn)/Glu-tRNA(Gln) amidotransferase subunit GatA [Peptococcia bacterium]
MSFANMTAQQLADLLEKKEISSEELTADYLQRIEDLDGSLNAFITVTGELALEQARDIDQRRAAGEKLAPLAGIPMAVKDNIITKNIKTSCASKMLANYIPPYNAEVMDRLAETGSVLLGKCNLDEFAMGSSTETSAFAPTRNPFNLETVPGGSSGGSAAAVAAAEAVYALGTDTGGSVRQPASFCGVVGMKPSYGLISRYGVVDYAPSLSQVGTLTRDVTDCALVLNSLCGHDPKDSTSMPQAVSDYTAYLKDSIKGMKIGLPKEYFVEGLDPQIKDLIYQAAKKLEDLGAVCEEVSLPHTPYAFPAYHVIGCAEASSSMARYDGVRYGLRVEADDVYTMFSKTRSAGYGEEVKRRILFGTYALSAGQYEDYYLKAMKVRSLIRQDFAKVFGEYDCLLTPTTPTTAFKFGDRTEEPLDMNLADICTIPANLAGLPAISLPYGQINGMPVGLQFIGQAFAEGTILKLAYNLEQNSDMTRPVPKLEGVC